jgi:hypothetical protein
MLVEKESLIAPQHHWLPDLPMCSIFGNCWLSPYQREFSTSVNLSGEGNTFSVQPTSRDHAYSQNLVDRSFMSGGRMVEPNSWLPLPAAPE